MTQRRTLSLKRDTLTELTVPDLAAVVGAQPQTPFSGLIPCITDQYRATCLNCE